MEPDKTSALRVVLTHGLAVSMGFPAEVVRRSDGVRRRGWESVQFCEKCSGGTLSAAGVSAAFSQFFQIMNDGIEFFRMTEPLFHACGQRFRIGILFDVLGKDTAVHDEVGQAYPFHFQHVKTNPVGEGGHLIGYECGYAGQSRFKRGRAGSGHDALEGTHETIAVAAVVHDERKRAAPERAHIFFREV